MPEEQDGADVWNLIKDAGVLDLNSSYSYLLWCKYFRETSIIVEKDDRIVGFISGFIEPTTQKDLFIWQVAVNPSERGNGLASRMLEELVDREICGNVQNVKATVSPSNLPSNRLFTGFAKKRNAPCEIRVCFTAEDFPETGHDEEHLYIIGPMKS